MFKAIGFNAISKGMVALATAAALAVSALGFAGGAEARINGDPVSDFARQCKQFQDFYDKYLQQYYAATTPEELLAARHELNIWMDAWKNYGCQSAYGDIRFIVSGTSTLSSVNVAGTLTTTTTSTSKVSSGTTSSTSLSR
jgi:hypothetical protein